MANYQKMYTTLFNAITDAIHILQKSQQDVEDLYVSADQPSFTILEKTYIDEKGENNP